LKIRQDKEKVARQKKYEKDLENFDKQCDEEDVQHELRVDKLKREKEE
jgi:hypothetical protein